MTQGLSDADLVTLEGDVQRALQRGNADGLDLLGEGEISLVLRAGPEGRWACKRLPPFPDATAADRYAASVGEYIDRLRGAGMTVVDTDVRQIDGFGGTTVLYCVQRVFPPGQLAVQIARAGPDRADVLFNAIVETIGSVITPDLAVDAQLSNWAQADQGLMYFDVTTPLFRRPDGADALDTRVFLASLPWVLRGPVNRWVVPGIVARYHDPRRAMVDLASNLIKEGLDHLVPVAVAAAGDRLGDPLTVEEVLRDRRSDARTWAALQAVRRADRSWQRRVRRRTYPFLLPTGG